MYVEQDSEFKDYLHYVSPKVYVRIHVCTHVYDTEANLQIGIYLTQTALLNQHSGNAFVSKV